MRDQPVASWIGTDRFERGGVAVFVALTLTMMIGFSALGTEVVFVLFKQSQMQASASSAALAGAAAKMTGHPSDPAIEARAVAASDGFTNGTAGATVNVFSPPHGGSFTNNSDAIEVVIAQPQTLLLSSLFFAGSWNIGARAVATQGNNSGDCVLALDTSNITADAIGNGAQVTLNQCGMAVNANGPSALAVTGGATLTASSVTISGAASVTNGGTINSATGVKTGQSPVANPYAGVAVPALSACKYGSLPGSPLTLGYSAQTQVLNPDGVYCGGLAMGNGAVVVMNPGVYIIDGGSFSVQGGVRLTGSGVTIVLTGSGGNYATLSIANGSNVTLSAPSTGSTAGLAIFQDPAGSTNLTSSFQGGAQENLTGALYFPTQTVIYANGTTSSSPCTQLVAWHVTFQGGASFNSNCANTGVGIIGGSPSMLVE